MANLVRWEPFNELVSLRDAMDRLFEEGLVRPRTWLAPITESLMMDIYETKDDIVVKAAVPGVKAEDIDISVTGNLLTIKGEFKEEEGVEKANYIRRERRYGSFSRSLTLPSSVDVDKAEAEFTDGILKLTLPKVEEAKPKTISVKTK